MRAVVLAASCLLAAAAAAQQRDDPRTRIVQQAVADLGDPARAADARRRLVHLGAFVVEPLRLQLQRPRGEVAAPVRRGIVSVLGRAKHAGVPALPELLAEMQDADTALLCEAAHAVATLLPYAGKSEHEAVRTARWYVPVEAVDDARVATLLQSVRSQAGLGPVLQTATVHYQLDNDDGWLTPCVCRWIRAHPGELEDPERVRQQLRDCLDRRLYRDPIVWLGEAPGRFGNVEFAEAWLALSSSPLDASTARALLDHWDTDERLRAVAWLAEHGAALPYRERADLAGRLWDNDREVAIAAANAFAAWGRAGVVALVPLRSQQRSHADKSVAAAFGDAAARLVAACDELPAAERDLVRALDAALTGAAPLTPSPASAGAEDLAAAALYLGQWQDGGGCLRTLDAIDAAAVDSEAAIRSVVGWVLQDDAAVVEAAFSWLARHPAAGDIAAQVRLGWVAADRVIADAAPSATECVAWLTTTKANSLVLRGACDDHNLRVVARALSALLAGHAGNELPHEDRLHELAMLRPQQVALRTRPTAGGVAFGDDASPPVRVLAAIALAAQQLPVPDDERLAALVHERCGVDLASLQQHVAALRSKGELPTLLDRLEGEMRERMGVPAHLRWPTVRTAK